MVTFNNHIIHIYFTQIDITCFDYVCRCVHHYAAQFLYTTFRFRFSIFFLPKIPAFVVQEACFSLFRLNSKERKIADDYYK